jgi:hypothetical protein
MKKARSPKFEIRNKFKTQSTNDPNVLMGFAPF